MFGNCLLYAIGISIISTGIYYVLTHDKYEFKKKEIIDYSTVFCIILLVSLLLLYITSGSTNIVVTDKTIDSSINVSPPF